MHTNVDFKIAEIFMGDKTVLQVSHQIICPRLCGINTCRETMKRPAFTLNVSCSLS